MPLDLNNQAVSWDPVEGTLCVFPNDVCRTLEADVFAFVVSFWASLQLLWTVVLVSVQTVQIGRQMTTLEMSNLGRYGFMGGKGGTSMAPQTNFMAQRQVAAGASHSPDGSSDTSDHPSHRQHHHGIKHTLAGMGGCVLRVVGLDLYTRGKAGEGLRRAGKGGNPFDLGFITNCRDFWTRGEELGVDYTTLYDIPPQGFAAAVRERKAMRSRSASREADELPLTTQDVDRPAAGFGHKKRWSLRKPLGLGGSGRGDYAQVATAL